MATVLENELEEAETLGCGSIHEGFKEIDEVRNLASSLPDIFRDQVTVESNYERFLLQPLKKVPVNLSQELHRVVVFGDIIDQYQEQPHLIDPHLECLLNQLLGIARDAMSPPELQNQAFKYLYLITKMRGSKVVVRLFPHEVVDVEPLLALINQQDPTNFETWETRYVLLLWLSMACMIPFDLSRLDSNILLESGERKKPVMDRILDIGKTYLTMTDKSRDAAAYLMSRFMTRPDVKKQKLPEFLDWTLKIITTADMTKIMEAQKLTGVLYTLSLIFKHGKREDLLEYAPVILQKVRELNLKESNNTLLRKLGMKVVQRLGLTFLKGRVATWRYQRGSRSLAENLKKQNGAGQQGQIGGVVGKEEEEEEEYDIPDEIEDVIEQFLNGLRDKDTIVRWSAAKGVGRITGRLPKELADEVLGSVLELFSLQETDGAWHGGCLALAELGRRGLLLPQRLSDVVPVVLKALVFDEKRGNFSVGAHVRDSACYVCWAFARAYESKEIVPYVDKIARALIIVSIFDREVNVRRASSAAFQENVGRQGTLPHGIDILTTCDYFAVGNRTHCYLELSIYVAQFKEYTQALIDHLVEAKINHWDSAVRELSAKALHNLTTKAPDYIAKTVLPSLIPMATCLDLHLRHGAILAAAEITHALSILAAEQGRSLSEYISPEVISGLQGIAKKLHEAKLFRGLGGELMRKAVCTLVNKVSLSKLPYHNDPILDLWQEVLDDCLHHVEKDVQSAATSAIPAFFTEYYRQEDGSVKADKQVQVIENYLKVLRSNNEASRMGYCLALGVLPQFMVSGKLRMILAGLIQVTQFDDKSEEKFAEARRDALNAITGIINTVGVERNGDPSRVLCADNVGQVYDAFFTAMKDYTMDSRGDVGAWVREASMTGLHSVTSLIARTAVDLITPQISERVFTLLVQQACEKIDRTRAHAGAMFAKLLHHRPLVPHVPNREQLEKIFPENGIDSINWAAPGDTFGKFTQLLEFPTYAYSVLLGLTVSVGGLTESLVKYSCASLHTYLRFACKDMEQLTSCASILTQIFSDYLKVDRVSIPMLKMLDQLLSKGCFEILTQDESHKFPPKVLELVKQEINKSGDPHKLMASADVFCGLLQFGGEVRKKSLVNLSIFLCHKFPRVRKTTANKLYEALMTYDDVAPPEHLDEIITILSETNWDEELTTLRLIRNNLCDLLQIPKPVLRIPQEQVSKYKSLQTEHLYVEIPTE